MADYVGNIAERLGISTEEAQQFIRAARGYAGKNLPYRQIYQYLENGRWSAEEIQHMAGQTDITLDPAGIAVLGTAYILGTTTAEAEEFIQNVDDHFPEPVDAADIWMAVQEVEPAQLKVRTIIAEVEINVIARELGIPPAEARELAQIAGELIGVPISNQEILETLRTAEDPLTIDSLLELLDEKSDVIVTLAEELDESAEEAQEFANFLRQTYPWAKDADILQAVQLLAESERKVQAIYTSLETVLIGRVFDVEGEAVADLPRMIEEETGYQLTPGDINTYIMRSDKITERQTIAHLRAVCAIAYSKNLSLRGADRFIEEVRQNCELPAADSEIQQAFASTKAPKNVQDVATTLKMNLEAKRLGMELDDLITLVRQTIDLDVSREQLFQIVEANGEGITIAEIIGQLKEEFATVIFIARELDVSPTEIGQIIGRLQHLCGWPVADEDVVQALRSIPGESKTVDQVRVELDVKQVAKSLGITRSDARGLPDAIDGEDRGPDSYRRILAALAALDPRDHDVQNVTALVRLADTLELSFADVLIVRDKAERFLANPVQLPLMWETIPRVNAQDRTVDALIDYLKIQQYFAGSERNPAPIDRTVDFLNERRHKATRFWLLLDQFHEQGNLSVHDLDYICQLTVWSSYSLDFTGFRRTDWLTTHGVQQMLAAGSERSSSLRRMFSGVSPDRERKEQIRGLRELGQQSWRKIHSTERRYQVPSRGQAEIIAPELLKNRLGLRSIRFVQEGIRAPGVYLYFEFERPAATGIIRVDSKGNLAGFHQLVDSNWFRAVVEATALSFYRDLVVPEAVELSAPSRAASRNRSKSGRARSRPSPRSIPGRRTAARPDRKVYSLTDWYRSQEIARHLVRGHTRYIGLHFVASREKQAQARAAGVTLKKGETWVIEHDRGDPQYRMPIELDGVDLTERTLFAPPKKASNELLNFLR